MKSIPCVTPDISKIIINRNMKHLIAAIALFLSGSAMANDKILPPNWQRIPEIKSPDLKAYYDANSLGKLDNDFSTGILLVSFSKPRAMEVHGKKVLVRSIAKSMVIDCKKGIAAPVMDLYFASVLPTVSDNAVAGTTYTTSPQNIEQVTPKSVIYTILCAVQV